MHINLNLIICIMILYALGGKDHLLYLHPI
jgi:hypothetical protein